MKKRTQTGKLDTKAKKPGRPKVLSPDLDKRHQLRCKSRDFKQWVKHSRENGWPNVSSWLRTAANETMRKQKEEMKRMREES